MEARIRTRNDACLRWSRRTLRSVQSRSQEVHGREEDRSVVQNIENEDKGLGKSTSCVRHKPGRTCAGRRDWLTGFLNLSSTLVATIKLHVLPSRPVNGSKRS